jgi:hypothetical protein
MPDWIIEKPFGMETFRHWASDTELPAYYGTHYTRVPTTICHLYHCILVMEIAAPYDGRQQVPWPATNVAGLLSYKCASAKVVPEPISDVINTLTCSFHDTWSAWSWYHTFDLVLHDAAVYHLDMATAECGLAAKSHRDWSWECWLMSRQLRQHMAEFGGWTRMAELWQQEHAQ